MRPTFLKFTLFVTGYKDAVCGGGRVLRVLGTPSRAQHLVPLLPRHCLQVRGQYRRLSRAAVGLHQFLLQPYYILLHEPKVPAVFSWSFQLL